MKMNVNSGSASQLCNSSSESFLCYTVCLEIACSEVYMGGFSLLCTFAEECDIKQNDWSNYCLKAEALGKELFNSEVLRIRNEFIFEN